jgi:hypothetical protein
MTFPLFGIAWLTKGVVIALLPVVGQLILMIFRAIVRITPTKADDVWFDGVERFLKQFTPGIVELIPNLSKDSQGNTVIDQVTVTVPEVAAAPVAPNQLKAIIAALSKALSKK